MMNFHDFFTRESILIAINNKKQYRVLSSSYGDYGDTLYGDHSDWIEYAEYYSDYDDATTYYDVDNQ